jgi:hypothetical protein
MPRYQIDHSFKENPSFKEYLSVKENPSVQEDPSVEDPPFKYPLKYPFHLEQAILNSIVRYNVINKSKNVFFKSKNFKDENVRDREIRAVLNKILGIENLGSYTVIHSYIDAARTNLLSANQLVSGDYNTESFRSSPNYNTRFFSPRFPHGGKTHRRKRRGKKSRKH